MKNYFVYIMASKRNGTLYIGVTSRHLPGMTEVGRWCPEGLFMFFLKNKRNSRTLRITMSALPVSLGKNAPRRPVT